MHGWPQQGRGAQIDFDSTGDQCKVNLTGDDTIPFDVLLEDGPVLVVNKPAGLLTQGAPLWVPSLEAQVRSYLKVRYQKPGNVYLGIPHRLDRPVSGAILFARNSKAAARLAEQFRNRQVRKIYWAVTETAPQPSSGDLTDWLLKVPDKSQMATAAPGTEGAKEARLAYRTLGPVSGGTLVEIELGTGRMHQIRVQLASRGWPIVGDRKYGAATELTAAAPAPCSPTGAPPAAGEAPIALHSRELHFLHPVRYDAVRVTAPLPSEWQRFAVAEPI